MGKNKKGKELYHRRKKRMDKLKSHFGCLVCGEKDHRCLQFAHYIPALRPHGCTKGGTKMNSFYKCSIRTIFRELRKYKILCANCHAKETYEDGLLSKGNNIGKQKEN